MAEVVVLGGYGELGLACARELVETTQLDVTLAGRSIQRAEQAALACGDHVQGAYANASDPRTLRALIPGARAVLCCSGARSAEALEVALDARVPFVGLSPGPERRVADALAERAWKAQVPVVLGAGAVPGIPGVLAEYLIRRLPEIDQLRIITTGPWRGTEQAEKDVEEMRRDRAPASAIPPPETSVPRHWRFEEPVGSWPVRPASAPDLEHFGRTHCVRSLAYLEVEPGPIARAALRLLRRDAGPSRFVAVAEAWPPPSTDGDRAPERIEVEAGDVVQAAAVATGVLVRSLVGGHLPAGLLAQREALNPAVFLHEFQKRSLTVRSSTNLA